MKKKEIVLIGGGGHCKSCIDVIEAQGEFSIAGIVDLKEKIGQEVLGYKIRWSDNDLDQLFDFYKYYFITIGQLDTGLTRRRIFNKLKKERKELPVIVSPKAYVSKHARIGQGSIVMHKAIINSNSVIHENSIINSGAIIEHDAVVYGNCHISTGTVLNGNVIINRNCFIGSRTTVLQNVTVHKDIVIGAGSLVTKDLHEPGVYIGLPARKKQ